MNANDWERFKAIKEKVDKQRKLEAQFDMTVEQYNNIKEVLASVCEEDELALLSEQFEGCEEWLKRFDLLPTQCNICWISQMARQVLERDFGWFSLEKQLDALVEFEDTDNR